MTTILIVEDNERNMKLVRDILRHHGYTTIEAVSGADGVRLAREHRPDLTLMDIQLPDIDGVAALREIRTDASLAAMPVVAVSASVMPNEQRVIIESGFDDFVTKPIQLHAFVETVRRLVGAPGREP